MSRIFEKIIDFPTKDLTQCKDIHSHLVTQYLENNQTIIRSVMTDTHSEISIWESSNPTLQHTSNVTPFHYRQCQYTSHNSFDVAFVVPTGVGAACGGNCGDATPTLKMIAQVADRVITHPNVVNASDLNEIPQNAFYVEGSLLSRLLMGTIGFRVSRSNRILVIIQNNQSQYSVDTAINATNAACTVFGMDLCDIIMIEDIKVISKMNESGRATGEITNINKLEQKLSVYKDKCDAIAITTVEEIDQITRENYITSDGNQVNPYGGVEALLTHWISSQTNLPSAHAPMILPEWENFNCGVVDARIAPDVITRSSFMCVLKGLMNSPSIVEIPIKNECNIPKCDISVEDINALVIPYGCLGIPVYAALNQGIPVIAVKEKVLSKTYGDIIDNFKWKPNQYIIVENHKEAVGVLAAMKAGVSLRSVTRPWKTNI